MVRTFFKWYFAKHRKGLLSSSSNLANLVKEQNAKALIIAKEVMDLTEEE